MPTRQEEKERRRLDRIQIEESRRKSYRKYKRRQNIKDLFKITGVGIGAIVVWLVVAVVSTAVPVIVVVLILKLFGVI